MHLVVVPLLLFALVCVRNIGADVAQGLDLFVYVDATLGLAACAVVAWIIAGWPE